MTRELITRESRRKSKEMKQTHEPTGKMPEPTIKPSGSSPPPTGNEPTGKMPELKVTPSQTPPKQEKDDSVIVIPDTNAPRQPESLKDKHEASRKAHVNRSRRYYQKNRALILARLKAKRDAKRASAKK